MISNFRFSSEDAEGDKYFRRFKLCGFYLNLGRQAQQAGDLNGALDCFDKATEADEKSGLAWKKRAVVLELLERHEEAIASYRKAVERSPHMLEYRLLLGNLLVEAEQYKDAAQEYEAIVREDPELDHPTSYVILAGMLDLALCQSELGNTTKAIETLQPTLKPTLKVLFNTGLIHYQAKEYQESARFLRAASLLDPENEEIVHQLGLALKGLNQYREAVETLKRATMLNPKCQGAWYALASVHIQLGEHPDARTCLHEGLRIRPDHPYSYYDLACLDAMDGNPEGAFTNLQKAVACGFDALDYLQKDPDLETLHTDMRWETVLRSIPTPRKAA